MTPIKKLIPPLLLSTLSVVAVQAAEDQPTAGAEETFKSLDKNADQRLSKAEAASDKSLARTFTYLDANGDGYLTLREYTAHLKKQKS
ncbi:MAG TPA: hypothetical protein VJT80_12620 [Steroidobacteraceae bacterium]|nr:hypothetical protein [Steroidobacteraceae bacterium]